MKKVFALHKKSYIYLAFIAIFALVASVLIWQKIDLSNRDSVRIGYFLGGRVNIIYRTYINNYFDKEGVPVKLYTKFLREDEIFEVPKTDGETQELMKKGKHFGKMGGPEIVEKIVSGEFDGGTIGESSFISSIAKGIPIIAVAMLGYDSVPGKAIIMRSDVKIRSPSDFKGKTMISRRAGPGDEIFFLEFLKAIGISPDEVTILDQVYEDDATKLLQEKKIDGGLYHLANARRLVLAGTAYVYRPMDWMDSRLSHAVLVFHKDYLKNHGIEVQKIVNAYVKRIAYEKSIPDEERDRSWEKGLMMEGEFEELEIPTYDLPPKIRVDLLEKMQNLLLEYGDIEKKVNINDFVDDSYVDKVSYFGD